MNWDIIKVRIKTGSVHEEFIKEGTALLRVRTLWTRIDSYPFIVVDLPFVKEKNSLFWKKEFMLFLFG